MAMAPQQKSCCGRKPLSALMAMAPPRLLRGLIAPLLPADWLPCHQQLLSSAALLHRWLPSLARLRCPSCSDGFKLLLVLLLVSAALAEVSFVTSASMAPTLRPSDHAVAEKVTYMFRRPSSSGCPPPCRRAALLSSPPLLPFHLCFSICLSWHLLLQNCGINKDVVFIKRFIAAPGDFIEVRQGQLIVNGVAQNEHYTAPHR